MVYAKHWGMICFTFFKGKYRGEDSWGNRYYEERLWGRHPSRPPRRWVLYRHFLEASHIPPEWFDWLHHNLDVPLGFSLRREGQKLYQPNWTGTPLAHCPSKAKKPDQKALGYTPWIPS